MFKRLNYALLMTLAIAVASKPVVANSAVTNSATAISAVPQGAVTVQFGNQQTTFSARPRLSNVLAMLQPGPDTYWPAARLFQLQQPDAEAKRQQTLELIAQIIEQSPAQQARLQQLASQISSWQLATPLFISIDYDRARLIANANPRFDYGQYLLQFGPRPERFLVMGATAGDIWLQLKNATPVSEYLPGLNLSALANRDELSIIQPNGQIITTNIGYWNYQYQEIMPGSILFIPFRPAAFARAAELNQHLTELAKYRIQP